MELQSHDSRNFCSRKIYFWAPLWAPIRILIRREKSFGPTIEIFWRCNMIWWYFVFFLLFWIPLFLVPFISSIVVYFLSGFVSFTYIPTKAKIFNKCYPRKQVFPTSSIFLDKFLSNLSISLTKKFYCLSDSVYNFELIIFIINKFPFRLK